MSSVVRDASAAAPSRRGGRRSALGVSAAVLAVLGSLLVTTPAASGADGEGDTDLYLVTLRGAGLAGYHGTLPRSVYRDILESSQDAALARIGAGEPVYRWSTALNGFAVELTASDAEVLREDSAVVAVERNSVRPLAGGLGPASTLRGVATSRGGAGTVVGLVDSGIQPGSSLFAAVPQLGRAPSRFAGSCQPGQGWGPDECNRKLVGARWFVHGFGEDRLRSASSLSPRDDIGHGTQMASIAAGNAGVSVQLPGQRKDSYGGIAPQARIAVYKACWAAPDPADDGCATADLVTAIDRATMDGVDVLNLSVGGPAEIDTVERALLGAAEDDVVVVAAAGNGGPRAYAAHPSPWVTSVGGLTGDRSRGRVVLPGGGSLAGAMASARPAGPAPLVVAARAAADGATRADARLCVPGSLDASRTRGAIVLCDRGRVGRVEKSEAVDLADGIGMVLANTHPGRTESDLHTVPTVHLTRADASGLRRWQARHPGARVTLRPDGVTASPARVTPWSTSGDPTASLLKPDLVAPAVGILGAVPPTVRDTRWDYVSGSSAAAAWTAGLALRLRAAHDWPADRVRSALVTSAASVAGDPVALREGAGQPDVARAATAPLAYRTRPGDYRAWLEGHLGTDALNAPSVLLSGRDTRARRRVTNVGDTPLRLTAHITGFTRHTVRVRPATLTLRPGRSATFRIVVDGPTGGSVDDGWIGWDSTTGTGLGRIPVATTR